MNQESIFLKHDINKYKGFLQEGQDILSQRMDIMDHMGKPFDLLFVPVLFENNIDICLKE
jgi:hypothetical protein